jgi:hypothetical protein
MRGHEPDRGWRMCACSRSRPEHIDTAPDPAGGSGCAMAWRPHGGQIEERHVTELPSPPGDGPPTTEVQPGGHLRQDVPAGLALPNHLMSSEENAMVGPNPTPGTEVPRPGEGGGRR